MHPSSQEKIVYELVDPLYDNEIKKEVTYLKTNTADFVIGDSLLARVFDWSKIVKCVARLRHLTIYSHVKKPKKNLSK